MARAELTRCTLPPSLIQPLPPASSFGAQLHTPLDLFHLSLPGKPRGQRPFPPHPPPPPSPPRLCPPAARDVPHPLLAVASDVASPGPSANVAAVQPTHTASLQCLRPQALAFPRRLGQRPEPIDTLSARPAGAWQPREFPAASASALGHGPLSVPSSSLSSGPRSSLQPPASRPLPPSFRCPRSSVSPPPSPSGRSCPVCPTPSCRSRTYCCPQSIPSAPHVLHR